METWKIPNAQNNPEKEVELRNHMPWVYYKATAIKMVWYSFPQYGKITVSPNGFYWPVEQLKNTTLDNMSHISNTGINNRKIGKWLWAKWKKI